MCIDLTVGEHSVLPHNAESGDRWANNVRPCGYAVANEFIMESLHSFSILHFQLFPDFLLGLLIRTIVLYYILTKYSLRA